MSVSVVAPRLREINVAGEKQNVLGPALLLK
jgi:hypothetical protein